MNAQTMTAQTFPAMPPMTMQASAPSANPLKSVLVTVFALKIVVAAFLVATVSLAPPVSAEAHYLTVASN